MRGFSRQLGWRETLESTGFSDHNRLKRRANWRFTQNEVWRKRSYPGFGYHCGSPRLPLRASSFNPSGNQYAFCSYRTIIVDVAYAFVQRIC
ncbi:MAG: hypothetical protein LH481_09000 [Burkholderiales bacterium]|nr:hypothetical protein [Burkholderiales bacterium]